MRLSCQAVVGLLALATLGAQAPSPPQRSAASGVVEEAVRLLSAGPFSVMQKTRVPPSGDKHDFLTLAPYWWPDPSKPGGLPYIRRDGEVNPESRQGTDDETFVRMHTAAFALARAYRETKDERFASRAALLLRTWFLDPATRMNPHLDFGQAVPGRNEGRAEGIIATRRLVNVVEAARLIAASPSWTAADRKGFEAWCAAYATWLRTSRNGRDEAAARNNHGTWYDAQLVALLLHTGQRAEAARVLESQTRARLASQIDRDGRQPEELARTRSWSYSVMNLEGWFTVATLASKAGVDLWSFRTADGRSIRGALDYLVAFAAGERKWTHEQITPATNDDLVPLLRQAATAWRAPAYAALADTLAAKREPEMF
jgi:hypothetical protein